MVGHVLDMLAELPDESVHMDAGSWAERPGAEGYCAAARSTQQRDRTSGLSPSNNHGDMPVTSEVETLGWRPTCGCDAGDPAPAVVLDCFLGAGTTGLVADRLGRDCAGIELNPQYAEMARRRIESDAGLFAQVLDSRATAPLTSAGEGDRTSG